MAERGARCLIVSANQVVTPYPVYPLGAACLVAALKNKGHKVSHFDVLADGGLARLALALQGKTYDLIGVSIRNLDTVDSAAPHQFLAEIVETMKVIRDTITTKIVLGGPAFSIMPEQLMELFGADYGVVGEGEVLLPWLAAELAAGLSPEQKILYSEPTDGLWQPTDLTKSTAEYYLKHGGMLNVQTKRGCPHTCGYCSYPKIEGKKIRYRDPDEVAEEVIHLRDHSGAKYIFFADSYFNDHEGRYLRVAEALIKKGSTVPWCAFFRPENLTRSDLRLLKRSGLAAMELGTDAGCDVTLAGIGKSFSFADVLQVHGNVVKEEIPCAHFIMFGGPDEDENTLREGLANIERLDNSVVFAFAGIRVFPDTAIHERAIADGIITADRSLLDPVFYYSPKISREKIVSAIRSSFASRMDRIYPCHEFEGRIASLHKMGFVGPLWDLTLKKRKHR
ncbi:MAG: B12-binding domain-containing radical SAM protein [Desulfotalea sp.]|nr:MAG: B12-binding domain-containing radical SAM protein [Desulfotalea sp.]